MKMCIRDRDLGELCRNVYGMHKDRVQTGVVLILDNKDTSLIINEDQNRDVNTTLIHTVKGRTILLQYDVTTPRPYSRHPVSYTHLVVTGDFNVTDASDAYETITTNEFVMKDRCV